jgi:integrase
MSGTKGSDRRATYLSHKPVMKPLSAGPLVAKGIDPLAAKEASLARKTFAQCAAELIQSKETGWRNLKHLRQWDSTIRQHCSSLLDTPVDAIDTASIRPRSRDAVSGIRCQIGFSTARTASVLDFAKARGWRSGDNPAAWRGHLKLILPAPKQLSRGHHAAMPYDAFIAKLRECNTTAARALEFAILTAARSGEVLGARCDEIDLAERVWTVPAARMKGGREHRVPLSDPALAIVAATRTGDLVFERRGRPLSSMAMLLRRMKIKGVTVHGFRSAFRDWAGNETAFPREIAEAALAHVTGDATERAYRRGDALEKRRALMEAWARHAEASVPGGETANVVPMARRN